MREQGVLFNNLHSYRDFGLILTDVNITPARPKTKYIDIPGRDEPLDVTEALGEVRYENRECKISFVVDSRNTKPFKVIKEEVCNALNGKVLQIVLDSDDEYYYYGRISVDNYTQNGYLRRMTISAMVHPYKLAREYTVVNANIQAEGVVTCSNLRKSVVPTITADADFSLKFGDISVAISAGENIVPDIMFVQGDNVVTCYGTGNITFTYQEGSL